MGKKINWTALILAILIPLAVGALSAGITAGSMAMFEQLDKPPLAPPGWLFPVVWTVLFVFMGISSYLICAADAPDEQKLRALRIYAVQLAVNFFWSIIFFNLRAYLVAFWWLILLWGLIIWTISAFGKISKPAAWLLVPYLLWVTFAGYLNYGIYLLN